MSSRRRWIISSSNSVILNPRRYVTINVTGNSSTQYYDGTAKTFTGTPTITYSNSYNGFSASLKNSAKTITETLPGNYSIAYEDSDFNVTIPDDGYDYIVDLDIQPLFFDIIDKNTEAKVYNDKIHIDGSAFDGKVVHNNINTSNFYHDVRYTSQIKDNYTTISNQSSTTILPGDLVVVSISVGNYTGSSTYNAGNLTITTEDNSYDRLCDAVYDDVIDKIVLIGTSATGPEWISIYGSYESGTVRLKKNSYAMAAFIAKETIKRISVVMDPLITTTIRNYGQHTITTTWDYNSYNKTAGKYTEHLYKGGALVTAGSTPYQGNSNISLPTFLDSSSITPNSSINIKNTEVRISGGASHDGRYNESFTSGNIRLYFNSTSHTIEEAVLNGYIEPIVAISCHGSATGVSPHYYTPWVNLYTGGTATYTTTTEQEYSEFVISFFVKSTALTKVTCTNCTIKYEDAYSQSSPYSSGYSYK